MGELTPSLCLEGFCLLSAGENLQGGFQQVFTSFPGVFLMC